MRKEGSRGVACRLQHQQPTSYEVGMRARRASMHTRFMGNSLIMSAPVLEFDS